VKIERLGPQDVERVAAASSLFDRPVIEEWAGRFLVSEGHHLLVASVDGVDVGFVTGVETTHPDKGTEMFLYELSVAPDHQEQGVGTALVEALRNLAIERGCYGMWVATEEDNGAALSTYRAAGAGEPEPTVTLTWTFEPAFPQIAPKRRS
jgi:ribosomal-protein-alanine N-acetyltransferase